MSLEEALNRNSELLEKQNEILAKVLGRAEGNTEAAAAAEVKKTTKTAAKKTTKAAKAEDTEDSSGSDVEDRVKKLRTKLAAWLGEFKDNESDPETAERKEKLAAAFKGLKVKNITAITTEEQIDRLEKWFEKALAKGRFTPEPDEDDSDEDDDLDV